MYLPSAPGPAFLSFDAKLTPNSRISIFYSPRTNSMESPGRQLMCYVFNLVDAHASSKLA